MYKKHTRPNHMSSLRSDPTRCHQDPPTNPTENHAVGQVFRLLQRPDGPSVSVLSEFGELDGCAHEWRRRDANHGRWRIVRWRTNNRTARPDTSALHRHVGCAGQNQSTRRRAHAVVGSGADIGAGHSGDRYLFRVLWTVARSHEGRVLPTQSGWVSLSMFILLDTNCLFCWHSYQNVSDLCIINYWNHSARAAESKDHLPFFIPLMAGMTARITSVTVVNPMELVRTKMQSQRMSYFGTPIYTDSDSMHIHIVDLSISSGRGECRTAQRYPARRLPRPVAWSRLDTVARRAVLGHLLDVVRVTEKMVRHSEYARILLQFCGRCRIRMCEYERVIFESVQIASVIGYLVHHRIRTYQYCPHRWPPYSPHRSMWSKPTDKSNSANGSSIRIQPCKCSQHATRRKCLRTFIAVAAWPVCLPALLRACSRYRRPVRSWSARSSMANRFSTSATWMRLPRRLTLHRRCRWRNCLGGKSATRPKNARIELSAATIPERACVRMILCACKCYRQSGTGYRSITIKKYIHSITGMLKNTCLYQWTVELLTSSNASKIPCWFFQDNMIQIDSVAGNNKQKLISNKIICANFVRNKQKPFFPAYVINVPFAVGK